MGIRDQVAEAVLETSSDAILATDRDGIIRFWNPGATRIFGFESEQALGESLDIIIPENLRARHWEGWDRVVATGESRYGTGDTLSVPALTADGRRISVDFTIILIRDGEGMVAGMAAILRDVTRKFEEMRMLRRRLAGLASSQDPAVELP